MARSPIGALFSSDLPRATETARRFNALLGLPVVPEPRLRERALGVAEGLPISQLGPDRSGLDGGRGVDADVAPPGGESIRDLYRRATGFIEELFVQPMAGDLVVVCHGGVVRVVTAWLDGVAPEAMAWSPVDNGLVVARALRAPALAE